MSLIRAVGKEDNLWRFSAITIASTIGTSLLDMITVMRMIDEQL